jgi:hypothetical protein
MPDKYLRPVPQNCVVTQTWSEHKQRAISKGWSWKPGIPGKTYYYPGVDFAPWMTAGDTPVFAAASGKVLEVRNDSSGYGNHVRIDHGDGDLTIYAHLESSRVKAGDQVKAGQKIGVMGWTGNVWPPSPGGTHLHWELRRKGIPTDPMPMVMVPVSDAIEPEPDPNPDRTCIFDIPAIPEAPSVRVIASNLNIRSKPSTSETLVGQLTQGSVVKVISASVEGADTWLCIGYGQYIAGQYDGEIMVEWVK